MSGGVEFGQPQPHLGVGGPGSGGGEGEVPVGNIVPQSILTSLGVFLKQIEGTFGADQAQGLATLRQNVETLEKRGAVSEGEIQALLRDQLTLLADNPKLPKADQNAVNTFLAHLNRTPRGSFPLSGEGNPYLECSATLDLFKMTAKLTIELAQIQLKEAMMRIRAMDLQLEAASCSATLTKLAGEIAAEKEMTQYTAALTQANIALSGALASAIIGIGGYVASRTAYNEYKQKYGGTPPKDAKWEIHALEQAQQVETKWKTAGAVIDKLGDASRNFTDAFMHKELSSLEIQEATLRAAAEFLRTLGDLEAQAASTLGQSVSGLEQEIKAFFDKYIETMRAWGQAWTRS